MGIEIGSKATNAHHALPHNNRMHNVVSQVDSVLSMQYNHDNSSYTSLKHNPNEHFKKNQLYMNALVNIYRNLNRNHIGQHIDKNNLLAMYC